MQPCGCLQHVSANALILLQDGEVEVGGGGVQGVEHDCICAYHSNYTASRLNKQAGHIINIPQTHSQGEKLTQVGVSDAAPQTHRSRGLIGGAMKRLPQNKASLSSARRSDVILWINRLYRL